jgi:hypothetical protein
MTADRLTKTLFYSKLENIISILIVHFKTLSSSRKETPMRSVTFKKGSLLEGININSLSQEGYAIILGKNQPGKTAILLSPESPPTVKNGKIYSTALQEVAGADGQFMISAPVNGGPHKRRNNKTLIRIDGFYPFYQDGQSKHIGGEWSVSKGNPLVLGEAFNENGEITWTDSLIVMSPGDIVSVSYRRPGMKSFFLVYEKTHRGCELVSHDSTYYLKNLNDRRPRDQDERNLMREIKKARCHSDF